MDEILIIKHNPDMRHPVRVLAYGKEHQITRKHLTQSYRSAELGLRRRIAGQFYPQRIKIHTQHHPAAIGSFVFFVLGKFIRRPYPCLGLFYQLPAGLAEMKELHIDRRTALGGARETRPLPVSPASSCQQRHRHN